MARDQSQYTVQINADASRAKKEINDLLKSLKEVGNMNLDKLGLDTQIREASIAADELAIHLKNATNANTGKLNLVEFNKSIQASGRSMNELITTLAQGGNVGQQAFRQLTAAIANTQVPIKQTNALLNNMMTTLKNTVKWELSSAAVHSLESALSGAVSYVEDLNTSLTNIRIVTNKSAEDMAQFAVQANKAAKELSATTKAYTDASLIYFQQGDTEEMAAKKAAITLKAAHSSFNSTASEMSEYLTAVWNSYKVSGDELQRYVDIMAALGANTATSLEEIATSMQKVAATANTVGVSMEQVSSIIATVSSVTRESAESIGTSYKTIFARIGDLKLGKTDEDGIGLGTVSSQLQAIGVDILDQNQNLREMGDIITDLGNRWQTMTSAQKTATAQAVAGKRQYTQLMALFDNWDKYGVNLATAMNSEGTLEQMNSMYEEGLKAAQDRARASMETLYSALLDEKILKQFANATAMIADNIANVVESLGGLGGVAKTVGSLLLQAFSTKVGAQIKQIGQGIANFVASGNYKDQYLSIFENTKNNLAKSTKNTDALKQTENMLGLKERLLQIEDSLTNQQAQYAQSAISAYGEQIAKLNEIEQRYISIDNTIKQLSNSMQIFANQNVAIGSNFETHFRNNLNSSNKLQNISMLSRTSLLENAVFNQGSSMKTGLNLLYQLDKMQSIGQTTSSLLSNNIDVTNEGQLQNVLYQLRQIQEITKGTSFESMFSSLNKGTLQGAGGLDQFRTQVQNFIQYIESDFNLLSKKITDTIAQIEDPVLRNNLSTLFNSFTNQTQAGAAALEEERAAAEAASNAHDRLSATLEKLNSSFNKFATYGSKVVGAIGALTSSYSMLSNATKNLSLNSDNLIQNIGSIAMGISTLIPSLVTIASIPGIGPILAIIAGATTVIGSIHNGLAQAEEAKNIETLNKKRETVTTQNNNLQKENTTLQELLNTYNELYAKYENGENVQDELKTSALELANTYNITGAAVAAITGNFEDFNSTLKDTLNINELIDENSKNLKDARYVLEKNTTSAITPFSSIKDQQGNYIFKNGNIFETAVTAATIDSNAYKTLGVQRSNKINLSDISAEQWEILMSDSFFYQELMKTLQKDLPKEVAKQYGIEEIPLFGGYVKNILSGEQVRTIILDNLNGQLSQSMSSLLTSRGKEPIFINDILLEALDINQSDFEDFLQIQEGAIGEGLLGENGLIWDNNASAEWKAQQFAKFEKWEDYLITLQKEASEAGDTYLVNTLDSIIAAVQSITQNEQLKTDISNYNDFQARQARLETIQNTILSSIGLNEKNTSLEDYISLYNQVVSEIDKNYSDFSELKNLEVGSEEYIKARNKLVTSVINDYTALDNYSIMYQSLAETFSGQELSDAINLIDKNQIKSLSANLLNALIAIIQNGFNEDIISQFIEAEDTQIKATEAQQKYEQQKSSGKLLKENMELADAQKFYDQFWNAGNEEIMAWEDFLALDYESRENYISTLVEQSQTSAEESARIALETAKKLKETWDTEMSDMYGDEDSQKEWNTELSIYKQFLADKQSHFIQQQDGTWVYDGKGSYDYSWELANGNLQAAFENWQKANLPEGKDIVTPIIDTSIGELELYAQMVQEGKQLDSNVKSAEAVYNAHTLIGTSAEKTSTKLKRLNNALQQLPTNLKELKDIAKQLGLKTDNDSLLQLINMSEVEKAKKVLEEITPPDLSKFKDISLYNDALIEYKSLMENATNILFSEADKLFTQFENRLTELKNQAAEEIKKATALSSAISSGQLSNADAELVGITTEQWNKYTVAQQAAIAVKQTFIANNKQIEALDEEKNALKDTTDYLTKYHDAWLSYIDDEVKFKEILLKSYSAGDLDAVSMGKFREAYEKARSEGLKGEDLLTRMSVILEIDKTELESQIKQISGEGKDTISKIYKSLSDELQQQAQEAVNEWTKAFSAISKARDSLLKGESLIDQLVGDPEAIGTLFQQYMKNGGDSWEDFRKRIFSNNLDINTIQLPKITEDFLANKYAEAGVASLETDRSKDRLAMGQKMIQSGMSMSDVRESIDQIMTDYYTNLYKNTQGISNLSDEEIAANVAEIVTGGENADILWSTLAEYIKQAQRNIELSEDLRYESQQRKEDASAIEETLTVKKSEQEDLSDYQKALEEARKVKQDNGKWEDISYENRQILQANGITGLEQVDEAAIACAKALYNLTEAAYTSATEEAKKRGYTQNDNGEWGKYHDTMSEEEGIAKYGSDWDQYKKGLTKNTDGTYGGTFEVIDEVNDPFQAAEKTLKGLKGEMEDLPTDLWDEKMKSFGLDADEVDELGDSIQEMAESSDELADSLKDDAEAADEVAKELKRFDKAIESVKSNYKDWLKALKSDSLQKQNKAIKEMDKAFSDMLDIDYKSLSKDFVTNAKNLELMKKAAEGSTKAYDELRDRAEDDLIIQAGKIKIDDTEAWNTINFLQDTIHNQIDDIEIGAKIDSAPAIAAMEQLINMACRTATEAENYLAAMGVDAEVIQTDVPETQTYAGAIATVTEKQGSYEMPLAAGGSGNYSVPSVEYTAQPEIVETPKTVSSLKIVSAHKSSGGGFKMSNSSGGGKKSGGGGGSKKKETKKHKRYQDEIERYHKNNETLSRVSEQLDKISKQKERVYGSKYIDRIDEETEALKRQLQAQQALYDEAKKYEAADKVAVARYGAIFDQEGTIVNYEEVMRNIIDEYNRAVDAYNASDQEDGAKKALEAAEERYSDAVKSIENYEEAIQKANEAENDMLETRNKLSAAEVEKITYKLEFKIEMNERDLELLEYYQDKYADQLDKQDELFANYFDTAAEYQQNLNAIGEAYNSLVSKYAAGLITEQDYAEQLEELHSKALDNLKSLNEVEENLIESYSNALELAVEQVEKTTNSIENANETLQSYMDILNLYEGTTDYKKMANFYDMMNKNNITNIEIQKRHLDALMEEEDKFQEKIRNGQELTDLEKKQYEALEEQIQETRNTLLSTTQEALETIRSTYENAINGIADDLDNFMAGAAGSLSYLQEQYEQFQEEQEMYVSTTKELYEVSKLNRDIEGSIADATSKASKEALKALQEKINKQSELNQLTEYDLQMNQLEYQLLLARINLEETKNAKDVVRLTRDDNGNYAYRYTANQDKIDEAAQKYEDVLQQINELTVQRISDTEQKLVNAMANYKEKFVEIATDYTLTEEERLMKLEELTNNFSKNMQYIQEQNQIATDNLAANQEMIADYYGASMSEITSSTAGNVNDNIQSMMNKTQEYVEYMNEAIYGKEGWQTAWKEYIAGLGNIKDSSGQAYKDMMENAQEMGEMNDFSAEEANKVLDVLEDTLEPLTNLTEAWNAHNAILNNTIETYENLAQVIQGTLAAIDQIPNTVGAGDAKTTIDGKAYAKGGLVDYTGLAWVDGTPDDPELMLNSGDTQNILAAASVANSLDKGLLRTLMESVSTTAQAMLGMLSNAYHAAGINPVSSTTLDQQVHITAEFPNVTDHNEIEEALSTLVNRAAQFANHK